MKTITRPKSVPPGEHLVEYAYPSSDSSNAHGCAGTGGFTVSVAFMSTPFASEDEAEAHAQTLGTQPARWSRDHPENAHLKEVKTASRVARPRRA